MLLYWRYVIIYLNLPDRLDNLIKLSLLLVKCSAFLVLVVSGVRIFENDKTPLLTPDVF